MKIQLLEIKPEEELVVCPCLQINISGDGDQYLVCLALKVPTERMTVVNTE